MEIKKAGSIEVGRIAAGDQSRRRICETKYDFLSPERKPTTYGTCPSRLPEQVFRISLQPLSLSQSVPHTGSMEQS